MRQTGVSNPHPAEASTRRASVTASIVSTARGIGVSGTRRDPFALSLATGFSARLLRAFEKDSRRTRLARNALRTLSLGIVDHNTVRMLVVDQYLRRWVADGITQLVILGAGLDSRRWRLPELAKVAFFEVDHESSQRVKRDRVSLLPPPAAKLEYVAVDFEFESLGDRLPAHGFEPGQRTAWVCEGVTPYLAPESLALLFRGMAELSAPGSRLVMSYVTPPEDGASSASKGLVKRFVARLGEQARGLIARDDMRGLCAAAGFLPQEDLDWPEWKARTQIDTRLPNLLKERLLVAEKAKAQ